MSQSSTSPKSTFFELVGRLSVTAALYPTEYVRVLIQLGHEPFPPKPSYTLLFGKPCYKLPGLFEYMKHIKQVDGFTGLYRGLVPKLCSTLVAGGVFNAVVEAKVLAAATLEEEGRDAEENQQQDVSEEDVSLQVFLRRMARNTLGRSASIIASQPFHVISIRMMAQFVGREAIYTGLFSSIKEIWREEGLIGFFKGMTARLVADFITLWLSATVAHVANKYIFKEKTVKFYINTSMVYVASAMAYPFNLVGNIMCVNNTRLVVGRPPHTPIYPGWVDCWSHLSSTGQMKRGSNTLWRYYTGPLPPSSMLRKIS